MTATTILRILCVIGIIFDVVLLARGVHKQKQTPEGKAEWDKQKKYWKWNSFMVGLVPNFFDALGIGAFAPQSALIKLRKSCDDINIPGTINVGNTPAVLVEAILFFGLVSIDPVTLISMLVAATLGSLIGAKIVTRWNRTAVRYGMGIALIGLGLIMACKQAQIGPFGVTGTALSLHGTKLIAAVVCNFILGALMSLGVGLYAPCMALVALLGMNVKAAFPIMMGSCAYLMAFGNAPVFIKQARYDMVASIGDSIFGCVGVLLAYFVVRSLPLSILTWMVIFVVLFTAVLFLRDARKDTLARRAGQHVKEYPEESMAS
ncbi:MAG: sulfite exporter TauE/SafE family protein [Eubacterium sp.]|jgi:uncharacterized membrane protein YfcA|uniref:TSUP family transporter n=1 Tax=Eubacterium sp. F2 TaxID=3381348 RepID=UPI003907EA04|nr:sulfite exporter TauE/SafE family protein [Eubacterium sp.]MCI2196500.1 sulfite exporter TauE/SafE family protein [Eubacterium sp.]